ncbi:hypothetical protein CEXT_582741 [Caerostris extrusa]|uniref:Uncharacterized protein n=1 Tax=Caerostris extrusa TaxID=172846 RepID=A0AAV4YFA4_CAEEX|nr:hypothetical protein CEXT_582741 [Caerostris extrusa]
MTSPSLKGALDWFINPSFTIQTTATMAVTVRHSGSWGGVGRRRELSCGIIIMVKYGCIAHQNFLLSRKMESPPPPPREICERFHTLQIPIGFTEYDAQNSLEAVRRFNGETASIKRAQILFRTLEDSNRKKKIFRNRPSEIFGAS